MKKWKPQKSTGIRQDAGAGIQHKSFRIVDEAVAAVISAIDHCKASAVILVAEGKEVVLQQLFKDAGQLLQQELGETAALCF